MVVVLTFGRPGSAAQAAVFEVPGQEAKLALLKDLFRLHRVAGPDTTLWDPWLPMSVLWWNTTEEPATDSLRELYRQRLLSRHIDPEGYVATQQHEGLAHSRGWPFPLWTQAGGVGWHFTVDGLPYGTELGVRPVETVTNWTLSGATTVRLDPRAGWVVQATTSAVSITSPPILVAMEVAPFVRLKWSTRGLAPSTRAALKWQREGDLDFPLEQQLQFSIPASDNAWEDIDLPLYRHPAGTGRLTRLQLTLHGVPAGSEITLHRWFTAVDSRHNINNAAYLQACDEYLRWTGDLDFLRRNIQRMRLALAWALDEFRLAEGGIVSTPWVGHDGRSGHVVDAGKRTLLPGVGVGNNYWDLLPFGGEDALATIYYFDAVRRMAALEHQIARHPQWNIPRGPLRFEPVELVELGREIQARGNERFWNASTGRFVGWIDRNGKSYDYGFSFLNNEAIHYGFASTAHARSIRDWLDGRRLVEGDTSTGSDIYHWRFGPRATTRRNIESYLWAWSDPASIPWGGQVQDGGAVLGFSFHDLMARLEMNGPDDAWNRLQEILAWFKEVQEAGGYRKYYAEAGRGSLQGGNTAGGLGLDREFFESAMVPQVMLYGFLGFRPRLDGCLIAPRLPTDWPSLTVRGIRLHDVVLDVTAAAGRVSVAVTGEPSQPLRLFTPGNEDSKVDIRNGVMEVTTRAR